MGLPLTISAADAEVHAVVGFHALEILPRKSLPYRGVELLRFPWDATSARRLDRVLRVLRTLRRVMPGVVARWPDARRRQRAAVDRVSARYRSGSASK